MADKERKDKDRSVHHPSGSSGAGFNFLPSIFGGRRPAPAPAVTSRISTSIESSTRRSIDHDHLDLPLSSKDKGSSASLSIPDVPPPRSVSPAPFDLEGALRVMDPESKEPNEVLSQMVKATAVHLANVLLASTSEDVFVESSSNTNAPTEDQLRTMYLRAYHLASPSSDSQLRIAAIRLLAALFATSPPPKSALTLDRDMEHVTTLGLFKTITTPSSDNTTSLEQTNVIVGALKALTKNGNEVEGMSGLVGWLVKALGSITDEWTKYCSARDDATNDWPERQKPQPFAPIRPATAAEVASAIIELLHAILSSHIALFGPADIARVVQPMLDMIWLGMAAAPVPERKSSFPVIPGSTARRGSPASTGFNTGVSTPILSATLGLGLEPLRSVSLNRSGNAASNSSASPMATPHRTVPPPLNRATTMAGSPSVSPTNVMRSPSPGRGTVSSVFPRWARCFEPLCAFLESLVNETLVVDELFNRMIALICLAYGQDDSDMMHQEGWEAGQAVMSAALGRKGGRRGELAIRNILEGKAATISNNRSLKMPEEDRKITRGAVIAVQDILYHPESGQHSADTAASLATLAPSLRAAQSSTRFSVDKAAERTRWQPVDYEILQLLRNHLTALQEGNVGVGSGLGDAWTEGQAVCDIMRGLIPAVKGLKDDRGRSLGSRLLSPGGSQDGQLLASIFETVIHQIPGSIGRLHSSTSTTPTFFHPRYIELLLELYDNLDEEDANVILDYYLREGLCLPYTSAWIQNIWRIIDAFCSPSSHLAGARKRTTNFILCDVYKHAEELTEHRVELVDKVILPFLEKALVDDDDYEFVQLALNVLVRAAVAESEEVDLEPNSDLSAAPGQVNPEKRDAPQTFDAIRALIIKVANQTACKEENIVNSTPAPEAVTSPPPPSEGANLRRQSSGRTAPSALRGLIGSLSPTSKNAELPSFSSISHPMSPASSEGQHTPSLAPEAAVAAGLPPVHSHRSHRECKSLRAVDALVSIFHQIAFAVPLSSSSHGGGRRVTMRCITLYTDLLNLVYPMTTDVPGQPKHRLILVPAHCPRARLGVLQWFMHLRADNRHRLFIRSKADKPARTFAEVLGRTREKEEEMRTASEGGDARRSRHAPLPRMEEDRGRSSRSAESGPRSRSRSQAAVTKVSDATYAPLWCIPTKIPFKQLPPAYQASEILRTYDPNHPALKETDEPEVDSWLPVSDYLRMINGVLRGHDWELVSFILSFLPLQLRNKTYFHGAKATKEIRALLDVICEGVMDTRSPWERRFNVPSFITRVKINSVAYQTLSILISYHGIYTRDQCDRLIQSFILGLQGRRETAKPCLQALTLCIYELDHFVGRHLLEIVERMKMILSTPAIAVHVLEFLTSLGQSGNLFRNFTDEQYRLVFAVATTYIGEHNARADAPSSDREEYTLSQHVIGLAYYVIYIWFMALRLPQRPGHVGEIVRNILSGRSQRVVVDEMAEVCFDWLARYTYGNADPRPATSFLTEVVIGDGKDNASKSQSWLLGGAIITVTAHARTGWATIKTTRPTGTTALTCKVENVPMLEVGEANADLGSLLAVLMARRGGSGPGGEKDPTSNESADTKAMFDVKSTVPAEDMATAQHGYVWSGATPSQRRKDVAIEPSYLALQLLSSYPNTSLETPRGRLIPQEDRFMRTLRGIENTPVIDTLKIAVVYVGLGQTNETEILSNIDGSPLYLDFLSGLGRLIRLKGQVDVFVGGLDRAEDSDGEYAYAWWDDLTQMIFHTPTMMPNLENNPERSNKKRLVGNDYVKIIYNDSGKEFVFDTIRTAFNMINIVIAPHTPGDWAFTESAPPIPGTGENVDREDFFRVSMQRAQGIPDFSPIGEAKIVSRKALPIMVRHIAHLANDLAARYTHIRDAADQDSAEYITMWRSRLRAMQRLRQNLPEVEMPAEDDLVAREELLRDFTRNFSYQPSANTDRD